MNRYLKSFWLLSLQSSLENDPKNRCSFRNSRMDYLVLISTSNNAVPITRIESFYLQTLITRRTCNALGLLVMKLKNWVSRIKTGDTVIWPEEKCKNSIFFLRWPCNTALNNKRREQKLHLRMLKIDRYMEGAVYNQINRFSSSRWSNTCCFENIFIKFRIENSVYL